nr:gustatory receptor 28 [Pieris rapae]
MILKHRLPCVEEIKRSFGILNPFLRIFSLNCDVFIHKKYTVLSFVRFILPALILGSIDASTLYFKILYTYNDVVVSIRYTDAVQVIFDFFQYIVDLFIVYRCSNSLEEYYKIYEKLDEVLGTKYCGVLYGKVRKIVVIYGFIWTISCAGDYWAWLDSSGWKTASAFSISYIFVLIKIITSLDMTVHLMHIDSRLRAIGDATDSLRKKMKCSYRERIGKDASPIKIISVGTTSCNVEGVKCLGRCYVWVIELAEFVNQAFGTRLLLNTLSVLIDIIRFTNIAARILLGSQHLHKNATGIFPVVSTLMRLFTCVVMVVCLAKHCEMVYGQRERIINIIDRALVFNDPSDDLKSALNEFRVLIQYRPVEFCMSNLVRIDYSLLGSMASIVVTYTIILLQNVN